MRLVTYFTIFICKLKNRDVYTSWRRFGFSKLWIRNKGTVERLWNFSILRCNRVKAQCQWQLFSALRGLSLSSCEMTKYRLRQLQFSNNFFFNALNIFRQTQGGLLWSRLVNELIIHVCLTVFDTYEKKKIMITIFITDRGISHFIDVCHVHSN